MDTERMIEFPATNEAMRALLLGDIAGIRNVEALESWGFAFASAIARLPAAMQAEIKAAYDARKLELSPPKKEGVEWRQQQMTHTSAGETA